MKIKIKATLFRIHEDVSELFHYTFDKQELNMYGIEAHMEGKKVKAKIIHKLRYFFGAKDFLVTSCKLVYCTIFGHEWIDESYGTPESGCIDMTCSRCGYNIHHTLY